MAPLEHSSRRLRFGSSAKDCLVIGYIVFAIAAAGAVGLLAYWTFARATRHRSRGGRRW